MLRRALMIFCAAILLAGCASPSPAPKGNDAPGQDDASGAPSTTVEPASTPPPGSSGQTDSRVKVDKNATFQGSAHAHDHWAGRTEFTILDREYAGGPGGVCGGHVLMYPSNECGRFVRFDSKENAGGEPMNVWAGTGKLTLEITIGDKVLHPFTVTVATPLHWDTFNFVVDEATEVFEMPVTENMTDPPHFVTSGWYFVVDNAVDESGYGSSLWTGGSHWTVKIYRSDRPIPIDPPHPDYWNGQTSKVLLEQEGPHSFSYGIVFGGSYYDPGWGFPENSTVIPGTATISVRLWWKNDLPNPAKWGLQYCGADQGCKFTSAMYARPLPATDTATERTYEIEVRPDQWDSPYATQTRWAFLPFYDNEDLTPVLEENGAFDGTIGIHITAVKG